MPITRSDVFDLVRTGLAASRADVARLTGMSASTASARVDALIRHGVLREETSSGSPAGRRPRSLSVMPGLGSVVAVDLGHSTATIALADLTGDIRTTHSAPIDLSDGPDTVLESLQELLEDLLAPDVPPLAALCIGVPGPVGPDRDMLVAPARMPGWNGVNLSTRAEHLFGVATVIENDANLVALGQQQQRASTTGDLVVVKVDTGIGVGIIMGGRLHRGAGGMAGDISHTTIPNAPDIPCSCGHPGCLDVVASGSALLTAVRNAGVEVADVEELLTLVHDGDPLATGLVRESAQRIGGVLATVVSFFNPTELVVAGTVSRAPTFMATLRSTLYAACLPATTASLDISHVDDSSGSSIKGGIRLASDAAVASSALSAKLT